jgi:hypothetical protein
MSIRSEDVPGVSFASGPAKARFETSLGISMCVHATRHALATPSLSTTRALYTQSHSLTHTTHTQSMLNSIANSVCWRGKKTYIPVYFIYQRLNSKRIFFPALEELYFPSYSHFSLESEVPCFFFPSSTSWASLTAKFLFPVRGFICTKNDNLNCRFCTLLIELRSPHPIL